MELLRSSLWLAWRRVGDSIMTAGAIPAPSLIPLRPPFLGKAKGLVSTSLILIFKQVSGFFPAYWPMELLCWCSCHAVILLPPSSWLPLPPLLIPPLSLPRSVEADRYSDAFGIALRSWRGGHLLHDWRECAWSVSGHRRRASFDLRLRAAHRAAPRQSGGQSHGGGPRPSQSQSRRRQTVPSTSAPILWHYGPK